MSSAVSFLFIYLLEINGFNPRSKCGVRKLFEKGTSEDHFVGGHDRGWFDVVYSIIFKTDSSLNTLHERLSG